jgi:hypothetical protein
MKISHFISGGVTEVVQGLLQAQKGTPEEVRLPCMA